MMTILEIKNLNTIRFTTLQFLSFLKSHKKNHEANFTELKLDWSECDKVICLGHSCSPVDMPYFKIIHSKVG